MEKVTEVKSFKCPICQKVYEDSSKANGCFSACSKKKKQEEKRKTTMKNWDAKMNELRLIAESPEHVAELLVEYAKRFFGAVFEFTEYDLHFGDQSCTHSAPIGKETNWHNVASKPTHFLGWSGHIAGRWKKDGRDPMNSQEVIDGMTQLWDYNRIRGLHMTGCFNGGRYFSGGFLFFLDDFPKMKAKYETMQTLSKQKRAYVDQRIVQDEKVLKYTEKLCKLDRTYAEKAGEIEDLQKRIFDLTVLLDEAKKAHRDIRKAHSDAAEKERQTKFPIAAKYSYDHETLSKLEQMFKRRW